MKFFFAFFFALLILACTDSIEQDVEEDVLSEKTSIENPDTKSDSIFENKTNADLDSKYSFKTINGKNGWGYQIFEEAVLIINQMHIPAIAGLKGFDSEKKASRVASYIINQIEKGIFPPTITKTTLDSLEVLN